jgi:hypothetical protein
LVRVAGLAHGYLHLSAAMQAKVIAHTAHDLG